MTDGLVSSPEDFYRFLTDMKFKVLANIIFAGSPGHQIQELDYFLRKHRAGDIPRGNKYLWVQRGGLITQTLVDVYNEHFRQFGLGMLARDDYFRMACEITRMAPELGIDVGLSHLKNSVVSRENTFIARYAEELYYHITNDQVVQTYKDYYRLRSLTEDFDPWTPAAPAIDGPLADLLGGPAGQLAVIHFRVGLGNAGVGIPAENMFSLLEFLRDSGFTVVKIGTEPFPEEFGRFGVVNYSESPLRSFRNDLALLCHAKLAVINASGLENLPEIIGVPTVSYARWHLPLNPYSEKAVVVPTLLYDPVRQRVLTFAEQILFFKTRQEFWQGAFFGWHFPIDRFIPRVPQADEMLSAAQEALALGTAPQPVSAAQLRLRQLDENGVLALAKSRVSEFFLERFEALL